MQMGLGPVFANAEEDQRGLEPDVITYHADGAFL
jgi:hypothetical protein